MDPLAGLFSFILSYKETIREDFNSIIMERGYEKNDMTKMEELYNSCHNAGIQLDFTVYVVAEDGSKSILITNSELKEEGLRALLDLTHEDDRVEMEVILAGIKSLQDIGQRAKELDKVLSRFTKSICISAYINKSDISRFLNTQHPVPGCNYHFWVQGKYMWESLASDPKDFLKFLWQRDFPIFLLLDMTKTLVLNFCILSNAYLTEPVDQKKLEGYHIVQYIAMKILDHDVALPYLMRMTMSCPDEESAKYIREMMPKRIVKVGFPFTEDQFYDFKKDCNPSEVVKDIISFANSCGGLLIYGVSDDGIVSGISVKNVKDSITNAINTQLTPGAPIPSYKIIDIPLDDGKSIITVLVYPPNVNETYYLRNGLRPFRLGSSTTYIPTDDGIREQRKMLAKSICE